MTALLPAPAPTLPCPGARLNRHYPVSFGPCDFDLGRAVYNARVLVTATPTLRAFARTINRGGTPRPEGRVTERTVQHDASDWSATNVFNHPGDCFRRAQRRRAAKTFSAPINTVTGHHDGPAPQPAFEERR